MNNAAKEDFDGGVDIYTGPIITELGTSLQNRGMLEMFHSTPWKAEHRLIRRAWNLKLLKICRKICITIALIRISRVNP
jgi:hypothetical protein